MAPSPVLQLADCQYHVHGMNVAFMTRRQLLGWRAFLLCLPAVVLCLRCCQLHDLNVARATTCALQQTAADQ